jgi:hypothetical protein
MRYIWCVLCLSIALTTACKKEKKGSSNNSVTQSVDSSKTEPIDSPAMSIQYPFIDTFIGTYTDKAYSNYSGNYDDYYHVSFIGSASWPMQFYVVYPKEGQVIFISSKALTITGGNPIVICDTLTKNKADFYLGRTYVLSVKKCKQIGVDTFALKKNTLQFNIGYYRSKIDPEIHFCQFNGSK